MSLSLYHQLTINLFILHAVLPGVLLILSFCNLPLFEHLHDAVSEQEQRKPF